MANKPLWVGDADSAVLGGNGNSATAAVDQRGRGRTDGDQATRRNGERPAAPPEAGPGSGSSASGGRRDDVQGLRALAVILVVLYHADRVLSGGYIGVDVFFVISGFVIMAMLLRELGSRGSIDMARFYSRRVRRLLPALTVMLTATAALSALILSPLGAQQTAAETGRAASLFAANARLYLSPTGYFDGAAELNPLLHTWSLAVEEQFYLLFPVMLFAAWRVGRRAPRAAALLVLVTVGVVSFAGSVLLVDAGGQQSLLSQPRQFGFYASPTRAWEFVAGALLAFVVEHFRRVPAMVGRLLSVTGLAIIAWAVVVSTAIREYLTDGSIVLGSDAVLFNRSGADRIRAWQDGFDPVLAHLDAAGLNVLVVQPLPVFDDWSLLRCPMPTVATDPSDCGATAHRDGLLAARAPFAESNQRSADRFAAVDAVDLFDGLCPADVCATNVGTTFAYRDGDHLTVERSALLASEFTAALLAIGVGDQSPAG